ncbi:MAG: hypothetical protein HQ508_07390 [Candidatus Marinimicrobia bacterium]|nr:hypothetical protein [Candidatus Neomarinimicrobiota bacterium]
MRNLFSLLVFCIALNGFGQDSTAIEIDLACETCHIGNDWESEVGKNFNHISTGFELAGIHADLSCSRCHTGSNLVEKHNFGSVSADCSGCHEDIHNDQWGQDCERCHNPDSWSLSTQQQNHDLTSFPLRGPHRSLSCESCHVVNPGGAATLPLDCWGCHVSDFNASINPAHKILDLDKNCEACHAAQANRWTPSRFNHGATNFALLGMHNQAECSSCHTKAADNTSTTCEGCHQDDYTDSIDPPHLVSGYPMDCRECHDSFTWNSSFVHDETNFQLLGAHTEPYCNQCHVNQQFAGTTELCSGCHMTRWQESEDPPHSEAEFDEDCAACHTETDWTPSTWDHDTDSEYPLTGAHFEKSCILCHQSIPYSEQASECYDCHQVVYEETQEPNHVIANIPTTCEVCHTTDNWDSEEIDHSLTQFPLLGIHSELECVTCHADGYELPFVCEGCHLADYQSTVSGSSPDHGQYGFNMDCLVCHGQVSWKPSNFDHDPTITNFEIQGAHLNLLPNDCATCHVGEQWSGLSPDCSACHQSNFNNTTDPDHLNQGFPENLCELCHSQSVWDPSIFTHEATTITCQTCHMVQYSGTTDPAHVELAFPTDCASCHTTAQWTPSTYVHDLETTGFEKDGAHDAISCTSCHDNWDPPTEIRTCASASCHLDNYQASSNPPHESMSFSQTCTDCHSTTVWTPSQFVHDVQSTGYLLEGAHTSVSCQQCHNPWQIVSAPRSCADGSCHLSDYEGATDPNHQSASFPLNCESCHSMDAWEPATFDHDGQSFPIYSGQHRNEWNDCSQCHVDANDYSTFTCFGAGCHNISTMNNEHCEGANCESCNGNTYPQTGVTPIECFTCHPNGDEDDCGGDLLNFFKLRTLPQPTDTKPHELD